MTLYRHSECIARGRLLKLTKNYVRLCYQRSCFAHSELCAVFPPRNNCHSAQKQVLLDAPVQLSQINVDSGKHSFGTADEL